MKSLKTPFFFLTVVFSSVKYDYQGPTRQVTLDNEEVKKLISVRDEEIRILQSELQNLRAEEVQKEKEESSREQQLSAAEKRIAALSDKIRDSEAKLRDSRGGPRDGDLQRLLEIKSSKESEQGELKAHLEKLQKELALEQEDGHKIQVSISQKDAEIQDFEAEQENKRIAEKQEMENFENIISTCKKNWEKFDTKIGEEDRLVRDLEDKNKE